MLPAHMLPTNMFRNILFLSPGSEFGIFVFLHCMQCWSFALSSWEMIKQRKGITMDSTKLLESWVRWVTGTSNFKQPKLTWTWLRGYMVCFSFAHGLHLPMLASPFTITSAYPLTPLQALHVGLNWVKKTTLTFMVYFGIQHVCLIYKVLWCSCSPALLFARASGLVHESGRFQITSWRSSPQAIPGRAIKGQLPSGND